MAAWRARMATAVLFTLNRWRAYATWPYVLVTRALVVRVARGRRARGARGRSSGDLPADAPDAGRGALLAQAATALAALEHAETEARQAGRETPRARAGAVWDWASRNLSAASERLLSPADRIERAVAPWSAYVVLPLFAFSATGVPLALDLSQPDAGGSCSASCSGWWSASRSASPRVAARGQVARWPSRPTA